MQTDYSSLTVSFSVPKSRRKQVNKSISILLSALKSCSSTKNLEQGKINHAAILRAGDDSNIYVATSLIGMYSKCGSLANACFIFDAMVCPSVVSWTALILGHSENGREEQALKLFAKMYHAGGVSANSRTYVAAISACSRLASKDEDGRKADRGMKLRSLEKTMALHSQAQICGFVADIFVASTLINAYANAGDLVGAEAVLDGMQFQNLVSWNSLLLGYVENGEEDAALKLFVCMRTEGLEPDARSFVAVLKACSLLAVKERTRDSIDGLVSLRILEKGMAIHSEAAKVDRSDIFVDNTLVDMYSKCGSLVDAERVFSRMSCRTVVAWTALILGYADNGEDQLALELFACMIAQGSSPNSRTFVAALKACGNLAEVEDGKLLILEKGMAVHSEAAKNNCAHEMFVANTLVGFYAKCGSLEDARRVFERMKFRSLVSWTALMLGYAEAGESEGVLELFSSIQADDLDPDAPAFAAAIKSCGSLQDLRTGRDVHEEVCRRGVESSLVVNSLVDFYGKCGSVCEAQRVFDSVAVRDSIGWTALMAGYSQAGDAEEVLKLFEEMQDDERSKPNAVTLACVLTACGRCGLVESAKQCLEVMSVKYGVEAGIEHYVCMADVLSRANEVDAAVQVLGNMPSLNLRGSVLAWRTVLGACRKWKNVGVGKAAFDCVMSLGGEDAAAYSLMADTYKI